jgi:hypothetical protein
MIPSPRVRKVLRAPEVLRVLKIKVKTRREDLVGRA